MTSWSNAAPKTSWSNVSPGVSWGNVPWSNVSQGISWGNSGSSQPVQTPVPVTESTPVGEVLKSPAAPVISKTTLPGGGTATISKTPEGTTLLQEDYSKVGGGVYTTPIAGFAGGYSGSGWQAMGAATLSSPTIQKAIAKMPSDVQASVIRAYGGTQQDVMKAEMLQRGSAQFLSKEDLQKAAEGIGGGYVPYATFSGSILEPEKIKTGAGTEYDVYRIDPVTGEKIYRDVDYKQDYTKVNEIVRLDRPKPLSSPEQRAVEKDFYEKTGYTFADTGKLGFYIGLAKLDPKDYGTVASIYGIEKRRFTDYVKNLVLESRYALKSGWSPYAGISQKTLEEFAFGRPKMISEENINKFAEEEYKKLNILDKTIIGLSSFDITAKAWEQNIYELETQLIDIPGLHKLPEATAKFKQSQTELKEMTKARMLQQKGMSRAEYFVDYGLESPLTALIPVGAAFKVGGVVLRGSLKGVGGVATQAALQIGKETLKQKIASITATAVAKASLFGAKYGETAIGIGFLSVAGHDILSTSKTPEEVIGKTVAFGLSFPGAALGYKAVPEKLPSVPKGIKELIADERGSFEAMMKKTEKSKEEVKKFNIEQKERKKQSDIAKREANKPYYERLDVLRKEDVARGQEISLQRNIESNAASRAYYAKAMKNIGVERVTKFETPIDYAKEFFKGDPTSPGKMLLGSKSGLGSRPIMPAEQLGIVRIDVTPMGTPVSTPASTFAPKYTPESASRPILRPTPRLSSAPVPKSTITPASRSTIVPKEGMKGLRKRWEKRELSLSEEAMSGRSTTTSGGQIVLTKQKTKTISQETLPKELTKYVGETIGQVKARESQTGQYGMFESKFDVLQTKKSVQLMTAAERAKVIAKIKEQGGLYKPVEIQKVKQEQKVKQKEKQEEKLKFLGLTKEIQQQEVKQEQKSAQTQLFLQSQILGQVTKQEQKSTQVQRQEQLQLQEQRQLQQQKQELKQLQLQEQKQEQKTEQKKIQKTISTGKSRDIELKVPPILKFKKKIKEEDLTKVGGTKTKYKYKYRASPIFGGAEKLFEGDPMKAILGKPAKKGKEEKKAKEEKKDIKKKKKEFWDM